MRLLHTEAPVSAVAFLPDGRHLACAGEPSFVWDLAKGTSRIVLITEPATKPDAESITDISRSPDGKWLAGAREFAGGVHIWNATTGKSRQILGAGGPTSRSVAYSPKGDFLALGSEDGKVRLWKL
jgi:WD40 repeat protein